MELYNIIFGFILFLMGWLEFALSKLTRRKREATESWEKIEAMLKARAASVMRLMESVSNQGVIESEMEILFELKGGYLVSKDRDLVAKIAEQTTPILYSFIEKLKMKNMGATIIAEILEMDEEIEAMAARFNNYVHLHNEIIGWKKYKLQIMVLRPSPLRDFMLKREMEASR